MFTAKIQNAYGEILELTNNPDYTVKKIEGLNPVNAAINTAVLATTDGTLFHSARKGERNIVITIKINGEIEKNRISLYRFAPTKYPVRFYFKNESRDVLIDGYVESHEVDLFENGQAAQISILCPNPFFRSVKDVNMNFSAINPLFQFTLSIPEDCGIPFSEFIRNNEKEIVNSGDAETGVLIELHAIGTVENPVIYNKETRERFALLFTMKNADSIRINTNSGEKSVTLIRDGEEKNIINHMDMGNDWFILRYGTNIFSYECQSGYEFLQITMTIADKFEGV